MGDITGTVGVVLAAFAYITVMVLTERSAQRFLRADTAKPEARIRTADALRALAPAGAHAANTARGRVANRAA